ncbi:MAG: hypothetical protein IJ394_05340 [Bacteroidales bacterium]|nr:hypothetical protein [Bacteroidales bacterium]
MAAFVAAMMLPLAVIAADDRRRTEASVHGHVLDRNTGEHVPFLGVKFGY